jgi:membrane protease YdiL (CAAX protease family)
MTGDSQPSEARVTRWESMVAPPLRPSTIAACLSLGVIALAGPPLLRVHPPVSYGWMFGWAGASAGLLSRARGFRAEQLGWSRAPRPSLGFWILASGTALLLLTALLWLAALVAPHGFDPLGLCAPGPYPSQPDAARRFLVAGLHPVFEEILFRFVLCGALLGRLSPAGNVSVSGVSFALMHFLFGVASLDNAVAGFILAWAFLRSSSIAVPIALHSLGNATLLLVLGSDAFHRLACAPG